MLKSMKWLALPLFAIMAFVIACTKTDDATDAATVEEAVDQTLYTVQERGGLGTYGCYELQFPVSIVLPDSSTVEVNSYEEMKDALRAYFEANGTQGHTHHGPQNARPRISFVFPITVLSQEGELITVASDTELRALRVACGGATFGGHGWQGHGNHGLSCFELVFPVTIMFPDSTKAEASSRQNMRQLTRQWHQSNPGVHGRPQLVFPVTVQMTTDSTLVTVNSRAEMHQLKEDCE